MVLYTRNGKLLVDNGKLAVSQDCCCQDCTCLSYRQDYITEGLPLTISGLSSGTYTTHRSGPAPNTVTYVCTANNLNGNYLLTYVGANTWEYNAGTNCATGDRGILIFHQENDYQVDPPYSLHDYIYKIRVDLFCVGQLNQIQGTLSFGAHTWSWFRPVGGGQICVCNGLNGPPTGRLDKLACDDGSSTGIITGCFINEFHDPLNRGTWSIGDP